MQFRETLVPQSLATALASPGRILVTGANGFVGSALALALAQRQALSRLAVRALPPGNGANAHDTVAVGGIDTRTDWSAALQGVAVVVHLAARVHVMREQDANPLAAFRSVNVEGTAKLVRQAASAGVRRFVYLSSIKVNGEQTASGQRFSESDIAAPQDAYSQSKWEAEQCLQSLAMQQGMEWVVVRPPLVYGPGVKGNMALLCKALRYRLPLPFAGLKNQRSLLGVDNLVDFLITVCHHPQAANQTFLVADAQPLSTPQLVRELARHLGVKPLLFPVPERMLFNAAKRVGLGSVVERVAGNLQVDTAKAGSLLSWQPPYSLAEGLQRMVCK